MQVEGADLQTVLKKYFGFAAFRPLQEEIIRDALAGRDVFALLPTGGGKSLCFQLPSLVRPGLTVVVSPLIALMKDQVDGLQAAGVPATFLNSSLAPGESRPRLRGLHQGEFRLLYVAPERLMLAGFLEDLKRWQVNLFAIDEAHCISEWGHDFRPEYRQFATLRDGFPGVPMMALTATATERVRRDIVQQLHLREPACYVASFNRPNLTYRVAAKSGAYSQVLEFIRQRPGESGIAYCQARKTAEELARKLGEDGVRAAPYHAGLEAAERSRHQEGFLRDEISVVCATIAFGMGINKPNVRFVIHYDLPKNIEGYYQETGRAGRDGLPSECLLLFSPGDRVKYGRFIEEKPDPKEREIARNQLEQIVHYAECAACRRAFLLTLRGNVWTSAPGVGLGSPGRPSNRSVRWRCAWRDDFMGFSDSGFSVGKGFRRTKLGGRRRAHRGHLRRMRQLPGPASDLGRHARRAEVPLVCLSHLGTRRLRGGNRPCGRGAVRGGHGEDPQMEPSHSHHLWHRRRAQPRGVVGHRPRTGPVGFAAAERGQIQYPRAHGGRPLGPEITGEDYADPPHGGAGVEVPPGRRSRVRRAIV